MLTAIVLIVWGIAVMYGGPLNALIYLFVFGDAGIIITVIEVARRKRNKS